VIKRPYRVRLAVTAGVLLVVLGAILWLYSGLIVATVATDDVVRSHCEGSPPFAALNALAVVGAVATVTFVITAARFARGAPSWPLGASLGMGCTAFILWAALNGFRVAGCALGV
jgi:hypothetical protein